MIGIDEVGRGCWAGPLLVVAARQHCELPLGLRDSKQLSARKRQQFTEEIKQSCDLGLGWVKEAEIDKLGLAGAMRLGVKRALDELGALNDERIIMDGSVNYCSDNYTHVECVVKADDQFPIVSAASIYAKVLRDDYMAGIATQHPNYGFEKHVGYGTQAHLEAIQQFGVLPIHRKSYKPIQRLLNAT